MSEHPASNVLNVMMIELVNNIATCIGVRLPSLRPTSCRQPILAEIRRDNEILGCPGGTGLAQLLKLSKRPKGRRAERHLK